MAIWNRLTAFVTGGAVATAAADAMEPEFAVLKQTAWRNEPHKVLDPATAAALRAREPVAGTDGIDLEGVDLADDAARTGVGSHRFDLLTELARTEPTPAELIALRRRALATSNADGISDTEFRRLMRRQGYEAAWITELEQLLQERSSVADVAAGVQQGHLANPGILPDISPAVEPAQGAVEPVSPDQQPPTTVPLTTLGLDPIAEAQAHGIDEERLKLAANLAGLPPGSAEILQMWNRGLIDESSVDAGIREGHLKTKWAGAYKRLRWAVLGASEYANAYVRGWVTEREMYQGGALTGHTTDQMDLLWKNRGRPIAPVQAFTAIARGAPKPHELGTPDTGENFGWDDFADAIRRSDVQTRYIATLRGIYHAYPPLFQLGRLAQANALPRERVQTVLRYERYEEQDIQALLDFWYGGAAAKADPWVKRAETQFWTTTHNSFRDGLTAEAEARDNLRALGLDSAAIDSVIQLWTFEADTWRKQLTPAQVKKAYAHAEVNPATGSPWTKDEAIERLLALGYNSNDAETFLGQ